MDDYQLFYKRRLPLAGSWGRPWDLFISAFNSSERVRLIADRVKAKERHWLMLPEYRYRPDEYPGGATIYAAEAETETEYLLNFLAGLKGRVKDKRIAIDITGLVNHYVVALLAVLRYSGVETCDVLYGEPLRYLESERTRFSDEAVIEVRQIAGFEGVHTTDTNEDLLVMAVGYDHRLVAEVANYKEHARKIQLFGLPSLRSDMYQESVLCASRVAEAVGPDASLPQHFQYAPAHDPFVTASVVSSVVRKHLSGHPRANIYLSPLSTKAQALGLGLFYLRECDGRAASVVYPFCQAYMKETSEGLSGVWLYHLELARLTEGAGGAGV